MNGTNVVIGGCTAKAAHDSSEAVLTRIADYIAQGLHLDSADSVYAALKKREELGSTGLEKGIALPHCSLPEADRFVVGVITLSTPIDFGALDGKRSDIFVYVCGPEERRTEHVRILAAITSQLRSEHVRARFRSVDSGDELAKIIADGVDEAASPDAGPFSLIVVYVQNEDLYEPILETVAGEADASVSVTEAKSAGSILHRMPLFATFWNEQESREIHRIEVVLPRDRVNRTIRQIEEINRGERGVQISAIDLGYGSGALDL